MAQGDEPYTRSNPSVEAACNERLGAELNGLKGNVKHLRRNCATGTLNSVSYIVNIVFLVLFSIIKFCKLIFDGGIKALKFIFGVLDSIMYSIEKMYSNVCNLFHVLKRGRNVTFSFIRFSLTNLDIKVKLVGVFLEKVGSIPIPWALQTLWSLIWNGMEGEANMISGAIASDPKSIGLAACFYGVSLGYLKVWTPLTNPNWFWILVFAPINMLNWTIIVKIKSIEHMLIVISTFIMNSGYGVFAAELFFGLINKINVVAYSFTVAFTFVYWLYSILDGTLLKKYRESNGDEAGTLVVYTPTSLKTRKEQLFEQSWHMANGGYAIVTEHFSFLSEAVSSLRVVNNNVDPVAIGVLLFRFFKMTDVLDVTCFIGELYALILKDFDVRPYILGIVHNLTELFQEGFTPTVDIMAAMSPIANKMVKLIGYAILGPLFYFVGRRFLPNNKLIEFLFMGVCNMESAIDSTIQLIKLVATNPVYLTTGDLADIRVFMPPAYNLYVSITNFEEEVKKLKIDALPTEYDGALIMGERVKVEAKHCMMNNKLSVQEVSVVKMLSDRVTAKLTDVRRMKETSTSVVGCVSIELVSPMTNIGKTFATEKLGEYFLKHLGYLNPTHMIYKMTDQKFDEGASSQSKVCLFIDPNTATEVSDPTTTQLYKLSRISGGEHEYISKAAVEAKQVDRWEPWACLVSSNERCVEIATRLFNTPSLIGRRVPYSFTVKLNPKYPDIRAAILCKADYDDIWIFEGYYWDNTANQAGYKRMYKLDKENYNYTFSEVLTLMVVAHGAEIKKLETRAAAPLKVPCPDCVSASNPLCSHFRREYEVPATKAKAKGGQIDEPVFIPTAEQVIPVSYKLSSYVCFTIVLVNFVPYQAILGIFVLGLLFVLDSFVNVSTTVISWYLWYNGLSTFVGGTKDKMIGGMRIHRYAVIGLLNAMVAGVVYHRLTSVKKGEFEHTMFSNHEVKEVKKDKDKKIGLLYPKSSVGVQDLFKWVRDHIDEKILKIEVSLADDAPEVINYATAYMIKGNRMLTCKHSIGKQSCTYKVINKGGRPVRGIMKALKLGEARDIVRDSVMVYNSDTVPVVDSSKFLLSQLPPNGFSGNCFVCYVSREGVLTKLACKYVFNSDRKVGIQCGDSTVYTYYNLDKCVPQGASGGVCYTIDDKIPIVLGFISGSSANLDRTLVIPWLFRDVAFDDSDNIFSVPAVADDFVDVANLTSKIPISDSAQKYIDEWGMNASYVRDSNKKAGLNKGDLVVYDPTGEWSVLLTKEAKCEDIPRFEKPKWKINGVCAIDAHLENQSRADVMYDEQRKQLAELFFHVHEDRLVNTPAVPYISNQEALRGSVLETLPLSSLALSTSSGFPGGGSKRNFVELAPIEGDEHNFVLNEEVSQMAGYLESKYEGDCIYPVPMCIGLKTSEPRKVDKAMRVFFFMNMVMTILVRKYVFPVLSLVIGGFMETGVAIGGVTFNEDVVKMYQELTRGERIVGYAADAAHFDVSHLRANCHIVLGIVELIFERRGWKHGDFQRFKRYYLSVIYFVFWRGDGIYYAPSGMASGIPITTVLNCIMNMLCILLWCLLQAKNKADLVLIKKAYDEVGKNLYGDDEVVTLPIETHMTIDGYIKASAMLGYTKKSASNKSSDIESENILGGVEFLKRHYSILKYNGKEYLVLILNFTSIYKMLFFREPKSTIEEKEWFIQVFRNAQFEVAFHGEEKYYQVIPYLCKYRDSFGIIASVEPWEYWMDKFLDGVAPYQYT